MNEGETVLLKRTLLLLLLSHLMLPLKSVHYFFIAVFHRLSELHSLCYVIKFNIALMQFGSPYAILI